MTDVVDGEKIAENIEDSLRDLEASPHLEIVLVGTNDASETYISEKQDACERIGFKSNTQRFIENTSSEELISHIEELNEDDMVDGILIQLPLPENIDNDKVFETLDPVKDVDGLTPENSGRLLRGNPRIVPSGVRAIEKIIEENTELDGKKVTIVNNSNLIGKPLSMRLTQKDATVTICHEKTRNLREHTLDADIVVTATGQKNLLNQEMVSESCFVIDAGYSGGSETENLEGYVERLSRVPNGVGPVTVAMTMDNLLKCFRLQN